MSPAAPSDETLMLRYRDGDADAFEQLYQRHRGRLHRYLFRQCGNRAVADELFQDVWLKLIDARAGYQPQAPFGAWLYRIAHNRHVDYLRTLRPGLVESFDADDGDALAAGQRLALADPRENPEARLEWRECLQRLADGIAALPEAQREAFLLRQESGLELAEIAAATGVSVDTARSRLRHATERLRRAVGWAASPHGRQPPSRGLTTDEAAQT